MTSRITTFLTFDHQAEEAANHYVSIFPRSRIVEVVRYGAGAHVPEGSVMTVVFELDGQRFVALNGGPTFTFSEGISLVVDCKDQQEVDHYWERLTAGGSEGPCGWLKDRFGVSWQVVPSGLPEVLRRPGAVQAMMQMKKLDLEALRRAAREA